jgi:hypothetical protein
MEVQLKLSKHVQEIMDYISFILGIPFFNDLIRMADAKENKYVCVTMVMPGPASKKFCEESNLPHIEDDYNFPEETNASESNSVDNNAVLTKEQEEAEAAWKETFHSSYYEKFSKRKNTTLITKEKYDKIVSILLQ